MNMIILALVEVHDTEEASEALEFGRDAFHTLVERDAFDYFHTFEEERTRKDYGDLPCAVKANSPEGRQLIEAAMARTKEDFTRNLAALRKALADSDERLWEENPGNFRFYAKCLGEHRGISSWIYNENGTGLRYPQELEAVLSSDDASSLWVVPALAHS